MQLTSKLSTLFLRHLSQENVEPITSCDLIGYAGSGEVDASGRVGDIPNPEAGMDTRRTHSRVRIHVFEVVSVGLHCRAASIPASVGMLSKMVAPWRLVSHES